MNYSKLNTNLLLISHNLELQGATNSLYYLAKGLKANGANIKVVSPTSGPMLQKYQEAGIEVEIFDWQINKYNLPRNTDQIIVNTILGYKFISDNPAWFKKIIWIIRESEKEVYEKKFSDLDLNLMSQIRHTVFVAESTSKIYQDYDKGNFAVIYNGIDLSVIDLFLKNNSPVSLRQKYGFSEEDKIVCIVGTVCPRKGQLEFAEAAINLLNKKDKTENIKFIIVGGGQTGNEYEKWIKKIVDISGWKQNILLYDETPNFLEYILMADIFVCNSYIESFPRITLEAMALGKPIITTNVYGLKEQIDDGLNGLLLVAGDKYGLSEKINYLLSNQEIATNLGINARKKLEQNFTYEKMMEKYINLIITNQ